MRISELRPSDANDIVQLPGFADGGGIDNTEAKILAVSLMPYWQGMRGVIEDLAAFGVIEERITTGPHGNKTTISIVRLEPKLVSLLMDSASTAVQHAETVMGEGLPTNFVGILVVDRFWGGGVNFHSGIQLNSIFDRDHTSAYARQRVVAHEIGHYWWVGHGNEAWFSEGAAEYIGAYSVWKRFNLKGMYSDHLPCPYYRTIEHLRADAPLYGISNGSICNYSLGRIASPKTLPNGSGCLK